MNLNSENIWDL